MRWVESGLGVLLALGIMVISGLINARFGMSLANPGVDAWLMASVAIFADIGKAISWMYFAAALGRGARMAAAASLLIFVCCLAYAVSGALGYAAMHRSQSTALVEQQGLDQRGIERDLQRKVAALEALGVVAPLDVSKKRVEALQQDRRFVGSSRCTDATIEVSRVYCASLLRAEAEIKKAEAALALEAEIGDLRRALKSTSATGTTEKGDFQSALIAHLTMLEVSTVRMGLSLLFVVMVESGACFLLWLSLAHGLEGSPDMKASVDERVNQPKPPQPPGEIAPARRIGALVDFVEAHVELLDGEQIEIGDLERAYRAWCEKSGQDAQSDEVLQQGIAEFCRMGRIQRKSKGGKTHLVGVSLVQ